MTVFCGPSGSGKTSLAMDTIYAEGQRRYVESLSSYARQFVGQMQKPQVDHIDGLSPAIAIEQRNAGHTPRSTVGTVTEIYDYFRILFARLGQPHCPECDIPIGTQTTDQIVDKLLEEPERHEALHHGPGRSGQSASSTKTLWDSLRGGGYIRVRIDGETHSLDQTPTIDRRRKHAVEVIVDRITVRPDARSRIAGSIENALALGKGVVHVVHPDDDVPEAALARAHSQPAPGLRKVRPQLRDAQPAQFLVQQLARLVPGVRRPRHADRRKPGRAAARCKPDARQRRAASVARREPARFAADADGPRRAHRRADQRAVQRPLAAPTPHGAVRHRRGMDRGLPGPQIEIRQEFTPTLRKIRKPNNRSSASNTKASTPHSKKPRSSRRASAALLEQFVGEIDCSECGGSRLRDDAAAVRFRDRTLDQIGRTPLGELITQVKKWKLAANEKKVAGELIREIDNRLTFLVDVGLDTSHSAAPHRRSPAAKRSASASPARSAAASAACCTCSTNRRSASTRATTRRLIVALKKLRDLGNTLLIVEHDREVIASCRRPVRLRPRRRPPRRPDRRPPARRRKFRKRAAA